MVEIVPAILVYSEAEFRDKIARLDNLFSSIQVDVMDGQFVSNVTWADPQTIKAINLPFSLEVHLMVGDPLAAARAWVAAGAARIVAHAEATNWREAVEFARSENCEGGVALNPETPIAAIADFIHDLDYVLVMGVAPGWSGQTFDRGSLAKIRELRAKFSHLKIGVDGGVRHENAHDLVEAGVDRIIMASALFNAADLGQAVAELQSEIRQGSGNREQRT